MPHTGPASAQAINCCVILDLSPQAPLPNNHVEQESLEEAGNDCLVRQQGDDRG